MNNVYFKSHVINCINDYHFYSLMLYCYDLNLFEEQRHEGGVQT